MECAWGGEDAHLEAIYLVGSSWKFGVDSISRPISLVIGDELIALCM